MYRCFLLKRIKFQVPGSRFQVPGSIDDETLIFSRRLEIFLRGYSFVVAKAENARSRIESF